MSEPDWLVALASGCGAEVPHPTANARMLSAEARRCIVGPNVDDAMNLPVRNIDEAIPFYESKMGFRVATR